jgi:LPS export ABC transporter protein LptC
MRVIHLFFLLFLITSCGDSATKEILVYEGPLSEAEDVEHYYTENDLVKVKMTAPLLYEYQNEDREFPEGVYMEFYDEFGKLSSTLKANKAYYFNKEDQWRGQGNVEVKNIQKNEQLKSEELFWKQKEEKNLTEKFDTIRKQRD